MTLYSARELLGSDCVGPARAYDNNSNRRRSTSGNYTIYLEISSQGSLQAVQAALNNGTLLTLLRADSSAFRNAQMSASLSNIDSSTAAPSTSGSSSKSFPAGAIAGIVAGVGIVAAAVTVYMVKRRKGGARNTTGNSVTNPVYDSFNQGGANGNANGNGNAMARKPSKVLEMDSFSSPAGKSSGRNNDYNGGGGHSIYDDYQEPQFSSSSTSISNA